MQEAEECVDVLVVGAGPAGLITAYQLSKFGAVSSVRIIEKSVRTIQDAYGRAITLFPRTSEMLDQLGLADELLQDCFACRETVTYDAHGEEVHGRGWSFMSEMKDTAFDFALVLRQKFQEDIFRNAMKKYNVQVEVPAEFIAATIDHDVSVADYRVTAVLSNGHERKVRRVKCKYLIGCDGAHSSVRRIFSIPFEESSTNEEKWVRVDGLIKTDLPKPRTYCSIESPTHGNVLWVALDRGATRIGFTVPHSYECSKDAIVKQAIAAVKPFHIEFERVDWWTLYTVRQRMAKTFFVDDCVFLAGDACHTHSSGAAQGMNTGIHDAVNLAWKLNLVLRRLARPNLLETYEAERLPNVKRLIQYDKDISRLMANRLPENWQGDPDADVNVVLGQIMSEVGPFSSGLGISYEIQAANPLNVEGSFRSLQQSIRPGARGPDVTLLRPGTFEPTRLIRELPNMARFGLLTFATERTPALPNAVYEGVDSSTLLQALIAKVESIYGIRLIEMADCVKFITILPTRAPSPYEVLQHEPLGCSYFDNDEKAAYRRYGIDPAEGAVVVLRPDGWIGTMIALESEAVSELEGYLKGIFINV
ncbi:hypothetical protein AAE478_009269 [Parahypoxylon ruwenzoriense]